MKERNADFAVCELTLVLFSLGALCSILCRSGVLGFQLQLPGTMEEWIAGVLALDAFMAGSLLCWFILPLTSLTLGGVTAAAGAAMLDFGETWWQPVPLLLAAVPLHFLLCGWSLSTAAEIRQILAGRGYRRRLHGISFLLMICAACASALILLLFQRGLI